MKKHVKLGILLAATCFAVSVQTGAQTGTNASHGKPMELKADAPGVRRNHRLILKDGSYQLVREYKVVGDRVRYISLERGGDWEELPADLIDWESTRKWESHHAAPPTEESLSPAMREARALDREESEQREAQKARMPLVGPGLELPNEDGVFALDSFHGAPELVELIPVDLNMNQKTRRGVNVLNPLAGQKASLEIEGAHAKIHLHVGDAALYISLDGSEEKESALTHAFEVNTIGVKDAANHKHGAQSEKSGFAIVRLDERRALRIVGAIHVGLTGTVTQSENVIATKAEVLPGKRWLKLVPAEKLVVGEYALVEILSDSEINQTVWDFRVDPSADGNAGSITPILDSPKR